jgi:hypothetical protein
MAWANERWKVKARAAQSRLPSPPHPRGQLAPFSFPYAHLLPPWRCALHEKKKVTRGELRVWRVALANTNRSSMAWCSGTASAMAIVKERALQQQNVFPNDRVLPCQSPLFKVEPGAPLTTLEAN